MSIDPCRILMIWPLFVMTIISYPSHPQQKYAKNIPIDHGCFSCDIPKHKKLSIVQSLVQKNKNKLHNQQASTMVANVLLNYIPYITYVSPINYQQKHPILKLLKHLLTSHGRAWPSTGYRWLPLNRHCRRVWPQSGCLAHITSRQRKARREKIKIHSSKTEWSIRIYIIYNTYINRICVCIYIYVYMDKHVDTSSQHFWDCIWGWFLGFKDILRKYLEHKRYSTRVRVCTYITCMCVCIYCANTYEYCMCMHCIYIYTYTHIEMYTFTHVHMYTYTCKYIYIYI